MAKNRRGQIDIPLITPVEDDIKEETESEAYEDEVPIDIDLFCSNEEPQNSKSVQDDPLELTVPQGSFTGKREFTLEMQKEVGRMVQECVNVLKKDPRECHLFYVTIQKWLEIGLKLSHIPEEKASIVWEKCDSFALSELEKYKKKPTLLRKSHRHNPQKKACSSKTSQVESVEAAWKQMLSSTTFSKHSLYSLETRLLFFQCAKTLTSPQECSEMNFLWDCLLSSKLQPAPELTFPDVPVSKDSPSKAVHKSSQQREADTKLIRESDAARRAERKNAAVLKSKTSPEKETVNADFENRTERGDAETEEENDAYQTKEQKQAKVDRERFRFKKLTNEQKQAKAKRESLRYQKLTNEQKQAKAERDRLRYQKLTNEQKQRKADRERFRRRKYIMEEKRDRAERERIRRLNYTPERKEVEAKRTRERRTARIEREKKFAFLITERGDAEAGEERDAYQTKEQKQAKVERDRLRLRYLKLKEEKKFAFLKAKRKLTIEQMKAYYEETKERRDAKTGVQKDAYLKNKSFRKERNQKEQEAYQSSSENELFSEVELETEEEGLTIQENFVFKSKLEFESEMEKVMTKLIQESVAVLGMDPREYHPFYVKLHLFIQAGLQHNFIDVSEVSSIWKKWDSNGVSQFSNSRDNPSTKLSIEEFENNHGPSPHLDLILFKRIPRSTPVRSWDETDREARYQAVTQGWRDILSDETGSSDLRSNLALRMKLFQSCSSMTFLEDSNRMTKYWGKLFNGELDTFEKKINTLLAEFQRIAEEEEEVKKQKRWARYLRNQALRASMTEEQKREESQRRMIIRASKTQEEKKEQVRRNKINRHKFTGERKKRHQESLRRSIENGKQKMEQLKRTNFEKWKEITEEQRKRQLELYNKMTNTETPEQRQKRLAKYKIYAKKALLKKQIANGVITEEEMEVQFQEAKKRIEEETFSGPPKPYKERPRKKKLVETVTALTPTCPEKVEQIVFNADPPAVLMLPESCTVILVDGKKMYQTYAFGASRMIPEEMSAQGTDKPVKSSMSSEVKSMEEAAASTLEAESVPRSPLLEGVNDYAAPFDGVCDEFEDNPSPEQEVTNEFEMNEEKEKEVVTSSSSMVEPGSISTPHDNDNPDPKSFSSSSIVEAVDDTSDDDHDLLLNSDPTIPTYKLKANPKVPGEHKSAPKKKQRVHKQGPRVKIPCPKCGEKINSKNLCSHYDKCGTKQKTKRTPTSAPAAHALSTEVFSCPQCSEWFSSQQALARHQYFAHGDGTNPENHLRCHLCFKSFRQKATLDDHIRRVHEGKGFYCDLCPNRGDLQSAGKLWRHKVSFHGLEDLPPPSKVSVVQCEFCGETVLGRYSLHVKKKHPEMLTQLKTLFQPKSKKGLTRDPNNPAGKLRQCPECLKMINTHWLSKHRKMVHRIGESFFCPECKREFKFKYELSVHIQKKHGIWEKFRQYNLVGDDPSNLKKRVCFLCLETFNATANAQIHVIENHKEVYEYLKTGGVEKAGEVEEKTFKCIKCLQDFEGGNSLAEHYKEEHNLENGTTKRKRSNRSIKKRLDEENGCRCEDCGVKFETREDWIKHTHTEHNEEIEKLEEVRLKPKKVNGEMSDEVQLVKAVIKKKTPVATKKKKHSFEIKSRKEDASSTVRRSSRKITKRKFIYEDSDSEDLGSEWDSKVPRVSVNVEEDSLVKQMKILKVSLVRLTKEEIEQYRFKQ